MASRQSQVSSACEHHNIVMNLSDSIKDASFRQHFKDTRTSSGYIDSYKPLCYVIYRCLGTSFLILKCSFSKN
jgi:hypothetical protein